MKRNRIENNILLAADAVQALIDLEFQKVGNEPLPGSSLDQAGLRNGIDIVVDYVRYGETGLALEHLVYMVNETEVQISGATRRQITYAAMAMGMDGILQKV